MPSQKLKRIFLGIVSFLILTTLFWCVNNAISFRSSAEVLSIRSYAVATSTYSFATTVILILGLYLIAKILIEIFK